MVSFVFKSTTIPFVSKIVLQQLSTLSLIKTRLRSRLNAIFSPFHREEMHEFPRVSELIELCTYTTANCDWLIYDRHVPVIFSIFPPVRNFTSQHPDIHVGYLPGPLPPHIELQRWLSEINNDTRKDANQSNKMKTYRLFKTIDNYKCEDYLHQVTKCPTQNSQNSSNETAT